MATSVKWWRRMLRALGMTTKASGESFRAGADFGREHQTENAYPVEASLSAYGAFPWVVACATVIAEDLSQVPLRLRRGDGPDAERIDRHPVLDLLSRPTSWQSRRVWERQLVVYWLLSGDAYTLMLGMGGAVGPKEQPSSLPLLHPMRTTILPGAFGGPLAYRYNGAGEVTDYPADAVLHCSAPSWEDGPESLLGQGVIRALANDLSGELAASKLWAKQAQRGRPDVIISPADPGAVWEKDFREAVLDAFDGMVAKRRALVIGGGAKVETPSLALRDMEFNEGRRYTRETVLAAFGVPPTKLGLPTANFATSKEQNVQYWERLRARAAALDDELTRLAMRWDAAFRVEHDFSEVPALQESRTERQERVELWWTMGVPLADAAAYEGFADLPTTEVEEPSDDGPPDDGDDDLDEGRALSGGLVRFFPTPRLRVAPTTPGARDVLWRSMVDRVHVPTERKMAGAMARFLRAQGHRVADRLGEMVEGRAAQGLTRESPAVSLPANIDAILAFIFPERDEAAKLEAASRPLIERALRAAFDLGVELVGVDLRWDPTRVHQPTEDQIGSLVVNVNDTTIEAIRAILQKGLEEGATIAEMQWALQRDEHFSAMRALRIARTETTRAMSAGTLAAYGQAVAEGVALRKQWLSSRDHATRDSHWAMDGQTVEVGADFVVPAEGNGHTADPADVGAHGSGPGDFASAGMVVNCRCTTIPILEEDAA